MRYLLLLVLIPMSCEAGELLYPVTGKYAVAASPESAPTPYAEIVRVLNMLPKPEVGFVDYGCGSDARWVIAAAEKWGCRCTGVEIDPNRAYAAKLRVQNSGVAHLVTIMEADAATADVIADVAVCYLYPETIAKLKPKLAKMRAVASYMHKLPFDSATKNGDSWIYVRPEAATMALPKVAVWNGVAYSGPNPGCNCEMCQSIRSQLATPVAVKSEPPKAQTATVPTMPGYHIEWQRTRICSGRRCYFEDRDVWVKDQ